MWRRCRATFDAWRRWFSAFGRPRVTLRASEAAPAQAAPPAFTGALARHPDGAALLAAARIETGADCPAFRPLLPLAARGVRIEATILATQGLGEAARSARIHAMIASEERARMNGPCR